MKFSGNLTIKKKNNQQHKLQEQNNPKTRHELAVLVTAPPTVTMRTARKNAAQTANMMIKEDF